MFNDAKTTWQTAKKALTTASPGLFKWWVMNRFQGHHRNSTTRCSCPQRASVIQQHVLQCPVYWTCFTTTATNFDCSVTELKQMMSRRDPNTITKEDYNKLNEIEDQLSGKILERIEGMDRPPRARQ